LVLSWHHCSWAMSSSWRAVTKCPWCLSL